MNLRWTPACGFAAMGVGVGAVIIGSALLAQAIYRGLGLPVGLILGGAAVLGLGGWDLAVALWRFGVTQAIEAAKHTAEEREPEEPQPLRIRGRRGGR